VTAADIHAEVGRPKVEPYAATRVPPVDIDDPTTRLALMDLLTATSGFAYTGDGQSAILKAIAWLRTRPDVVEELGLGWPAVKVEVTHGWSDLEAPDPDPRDPRWDGIETPGMGTATEGWARRNVREEAEAGRTAHVFRREIRLGPWVRLPDEEKP
jgi:hypothetical protein